MVDDVFRVMDALGFDTWVLGGESMGSVVAMLAAQAHPGDLCRGRSVADVGCGSGRITAHLHDCGVDAFGLNASA